MGEERGLTSLSIRKVAARAGLVPTAFYRHFSSIEELGLSLVEQMGERLRGLLRLARRDGRAFKTAIRESVRVFYRYVDKNPLLFRFTVRERVGSNAKIRKSIGRELEQFSGELAGDLRDFQALPNLPEEDLRLLASMVIHTAFTQSIDYLDLPKNDKKGRQKELDKLVRQLRVIFRGFLWRRAGRRSRAATRD